VYIDSCDFLFSCSWADTLRKLLYLHVLNSVRRSQYFLKKIRSIISLHHIAISSVTFTVTVNVKDCYVEGKEGRKKPEPMQYGNREASLASAFKRCDDKNVSSLIWFRSISEIKDRNEGDFRFIYSSILLLFNNNTTDFPCIWTTRCEIDVWNTMMSWFVCFFSPCPPIDSNHKSTRSQSWPQLQPLLSLLVKTRACVRYIAVVDLAAAAVAAAAAGGSVAVWASIIVLHSSSRQHRRLLCLLATDTVAVSDRLLMMLLTLSHSGTADELLLHPKSIY
jgi:hypothetical protein